MFHDDAWLAGVFEGEGSCTIHRRGSTRVQIHLTINSTDEDVVAAVHAAARCGRIYGPYQPQAIGKGCKKQQWRWAVTRWADVLELMDRLEPFLLARRSARIQEARAALLAYRATKEVAA